MQNDYRMRSLTNKASGTLFKLMPDDEAAIAASSRTVPAIAWWVLVVLLLVTAVVSYVLHSATDRAGAEAFRAQTEDVRHNIAQRLLAYEQVLHGGLGLFAASEDVTQDEWHRYVKNLSLDQHFPGIQGLGYAQWVSAEEKEDFIRRVRAESHPDFKIVPSGDRPTYSVIRYLEPFNERNQRAFGYDMFAESMRRMAMEEARDKGATAISGSVILIQETEENMQHGFLMYVPHYRRGAPTQAVEDRRRALLGFVYSPFRMGDFMGGVLQEETPSICIDIHDGETVSPDTLMYRSEAMIGTSRPRYTRTVQLTRYGHTWTLAMASKPSFEAQLDWQKPRMITAAGLIISFLFFGLVWALATHRTRALALARRITGQLREREAYIRAIVDHAAEAIVTVNESERIISVNPAVEQMFGYTSEEILGRPLALLVPGDMQLSPPETAGSYITQESEGLHKDGTKFPIELTKSDYQQSSRPVTTLMIRDITSRKRAEQALRLSEERFHLAMRGANDGLWDWDLANDTVYYSPRWKSMLGYDDQEVANDYEAWRSRVHPDDVEAAAAALRAHIEGKTPSYQAELRMRHRDGHYIWILSRGRVQHDAHGTPIRVVGTHTDISEQKEVQRLKSEFVSTVSHELRTPLTSIRGSLGLLAGGVAGQLSAHAVSLLNIALKNCERLLDLINDLLDVEKIQTGNMEFHMQPHDLLPLIEQCMESNRAYGQQFGVTYVMTGAPAAAWAVVDANRFQQVMSNLLSNSAKFSHPGSRVEISVSTAGGRITVAVKDFGVGIPADFQRRVFERFSQADSSDSRYKGGTGLGLNISKALVERMDGKIGFATQVGRGTTFWVNFPEWNEP